MPLGKESNSSPLGFLREKEFDKSQTLSQITCHCSFWLGKFYINISLVVSESFKLFWLPHAPPNSAIPPLLTLFGNVARKCSINLGLFTGYYYYFKNKITTCHFCTRPTFIHALWPQSFQLVKITGNVWQVWWWGLKLVIVMGFETHAGCG